MLRSLCAKFTLAALLAGTMAVTGVAAPAQATVVAVKQCTATVTLVAQWAGGFIANITVTNTGTEPITSWTAVIVFPTSVVTIVSQPWNGTLPPGASTTTGLIGSGNYTPPTSVTCHPG